MLKKRFFISWILSSVSMFTLSLIWHGILLNDLKFITVPPQLFYSLAVLAYLVIGFALSFTYTYLSMGIGLKLKGSLMGMALGFFIYLIAFVLGVSFQGGSADHVVVDFIWQMIEQGFGGSIVGGVYLLARRRDQVFGKA